MRKDSKKGKYYVLRSFKQRNNVCSVYLECKLTQYTYGWCIFKLKYWKMVENTYLETRKQQRSYNWCFSVLKFYGKVTILLLESVNKQADTVYLFTV